MTKSACFTGHRPQKLVLPYDENSTTIKYIKAALREQILMAITDGYTQFYSGMAKGVDIIASEIVLSYQKRFPTIKLICVIPYRQQTKGWETNWTLRYNDILKKSNQQVFLSENYYDGCFNFRNTYMVNNSTRVIAVWNGEPSGTSSTLRYAKRLQKEVCVISI